MINLIKKINTDLIIFLSIFSVIFIATGNHKSDYKTLIILELFLIFIILKKDKLYLEFKELIIKKNLFISLIILFTISISISFIFSPLQIEQFSIELSGIRYVYTVTSIFLFSTFFIYFNTNKIDYSYLFYAVVIPGLIFSIYILIIFIQNKGIEVHDEKLLFFSNIRQIGLYLTFISCFCISYWIYEIKNIGEKKIIFSLFIFLTLTILLGNRGSLISLVISFIFFLTILKFKNIKIKKKIILFLLCLFFAYCLNEIVIFLSDLSYPKTNLKTTSFDLMRIDAYSFNDRLAMWSYGVELIKRYPIFGLGSNGFFIESINNKYTTGYPVFSYHTHPHNFIIQFLVEWGILGCSIIFFLFGKVFLTTLKNIFKYKKKIILIPLISFLGPTLHGLIDGNFYHSVSTFFIVLSLSLLMVEIKKNN